MKTIRTANGDFLNELGKKIYCYYWEPTENPRALVMLCHGFTEHCSQYSNLAQELAKKNFFVYAHDHIGHGRSEGTRGYLSKFSTVVKDILTHTELVKKRFPSLPIFLCGHSMGGSSSILAAMERPNVFSGLVLIAPALMSNPETATAPRIIIARLLNRILPHFPLAYADFSLCCRDESEVEKMNADPLRYHGYCKARFALCLVDSGKEILDKCKSIKFPFLIMHGDADLVCNVKGSRIMHENASSSDKTLKNFYVCSWYNSTQDIQRLSLTVTPGCKSTDVEQTRIIDLLLNIVYSNAYHCLLYEPEGIAEDVVQRTVQWLEERA